MRHQAERPRSTTERNFPASLRELLALDDEELGRLVVERQKRREDLSRKRLGIVLKRLRQEQGMTLHELALESSTSARVLWLIEEAALPIDQVSDEVLAAAADALETEVDELEARASRMNDAEVAAYLDYRGPGELVGEIAPARDGVWLHTKRLPLQLVADGDELLVGPAPELAYSQLTFDAGVGSQPLLSVFLPNSGKLRLQLPRSDKPIRVYLD